MENTRDRIDVDVIPPGSIVVGLDGSDQAQEAFAWAAEQAALENRRLAIVVAVEPISATSRSMLLGAGLDPHALQAQILDEARQQARTAAELATDLHPGLEVVQVLRAEDARDLLLAAAHRASLLVVGSRGRGALRSRLLGSVSVAVAKHAACPVAVLRPRPDADTPRHGILVGADGTARSQPALEFAYRQASLRNLPLTVMHCFWDVVASPALTQLVDVTPESQEELRLLLAESVAGMSEKYPDVVVHRRLTRGLVDEALASGAEEMDMVVVGWHDPDPVAAFVFGAVAPSVLERAHTTVVVVPSRADDDVER